MKIINCGLCRWSGDGKGLIYIINEKTLCTA